MKVYDSAGQLKITGAGGGGGNTGSISAGTTQATLGAVVFSNSNGISFGVDGQMVTAQHNALTSQSNQNITAANGGFAFQTLSFSNLNGISFGTSAGSAITASHNALTSQSNQAFSAAGGSSAFQTLSFNNANGVSFSNNGGAVEASVATSLSNIRVSAGTTSNLLSAITFNNANGVSFGLDASTITGSVATSLTNIRLSAGTTSNLLSAVTFSNANGVSFGLDAGTLTASVAVAGGAQTGISGIVVSDTTYTSGTVSFSNANGITFGSSAGQAITASHNALTSQSNQNVTAGNGGFAFQTLSFSNVNGFSFGTSAGSAITGSYTVPTQTNQTGGIYVTAQSTGQSSSSTYDLRTLSFVPDGIISAGWSNGSFRVSATQSNQAFSADASSTFQTLTFQNSNGFTFSNNAGAIRASYSVPVVSNAIQSVGSATNSGTNTSRFAADDHVHAGVFSMGVSNDAGNTAGDTRVDVGRFVIRGGNQITVSQITAANALNTIVISGAAPGAAAITQSIGMSTQTAGGATAGTTGYATGDDILYHFAPGSNITMSQSVNGASATLSIYGAGGGAGYTKSGFYPYADRVKVAGQAGQGTLNIDPMYVGVPFQCDRIVMPIINTNSSNSSGSHTLSFWAGIYTRNAATLSLLTSTSSSTALTHSGTAGSYSLYSGLRLFTIPFTTTLTQADYWLAVLSRTTSGGENGTYSQQLLSNINTNFLGHFGSSHNTTYQLTLGQGVYTATTNGIPNAISFSQIRGSDSLARRAPDVMFASSTV